MDHKVAFFHLLPLFSHIFFPILYFFLAALPLVGELRFFSSIYIRLLHPIYKLSGIRRSKMAEAGKQGGFWQNKRCHQAAGVLHITACPPRFSDLVPSLKIVSIKHVAFTQPWLLKGFPGLFSKVHGFPSSYILRRPQKIDKISQLALILVSKHHINWENIFCGLLGIFMNVKLHAPPENISPQ